MTPRAAAHLRKTGAVPGITESTRIDAIKMNTTTFQGGSIVSLLFLDGSETPSYVLRMPRDPSRPERVRANFEALKRLKGTSFAHAGIPEPIYLGEMGDSLLTIETCKHGEAMIAEIDDAGSDPQRLESLLDHVFEWIWGLHRETQYSNGVSAYRSALRDCELLIENGLTPTESFVNARNAIEAVAESRPFCSMLHGDFNPNNVLLSPDGRPSGVVDWEYSCDGASVLDLFSMARIGWISADSDNARLAGRINAMLAGDPPVGPSLMKALNRYGAADNPKPYFLVYLMRMIADYVRATGNPGDQSLRPWIAYVNDSIAPRRRRAPRSGQLAGSV